MENPNNIKVGDIILVEQAWEDNAGLYVDERAEVLSIKDNGELELNFTKNEKVNESLQDAEFFAKDYKPEQ